MVAQNCGLVLLLFCCAINQANALSKEEAIELLREGGYTILFRHAATDYSKKDSDYDDYRNCEAQRRLSDWGRQQSTLIGQAFEKAKITVGKVYSSQFCRCENTAKLAFGRVELRYDLSSYVASAPLEKQRRVMVIRKVVSEAPKSGTNTVIVGHRFMIREATGYDLEEGQAAFFKPGGNRQFEFVGKIDPAQW